MKNNTRITRINDEILREVSIIIRSELKDPRISTITTVTKVDTTNDLKHCKLHISVMGDDIQKKAALQGLKNAAGFIRRQIAERINLRNTPEMSFVLDESLDYSFKITKLINEINEKNMEVSDENSD